jgi:hypothetical protein
MFHRAIMKRGNLTLSPVLMTAASNGWIVRWLSRGQVLPGHEVFFAYRELVAGRLEQLFLEWLDHVVVLSEVVI